MSNSAPHPDDETLRLFAVGRLTERQGDDIEAHLADCEICTRRLDSLERRKSDPFLREMQAAHHVEPSGDFSSGIRIGNFRLETPLGRGGMGEAWKAFDETAKRYVVLKFVPKDVQHISSAMNAVLDSFQKVHALQHSHICPLYLVDNDKEHGFFLVMKFIDGLPLDAHSRQRGPLPFDKIVQILRDVADALDYSHNKKVIHRDVKPANIMIGETDGAQLIDFGLADEIRATLSVELSDTKITGTRSYMAPEQWEGRKQDARTDQYALAVTAYELLSGNVPFSGPDTEVLKKAVLTAFPIPIPTVPNHVNAALFRGLSKNRNYRFDNYRAFVESLSTEYRLNVPPPLPIKTKAVPWKWIAPAIVVALFLLSVLGIYLNRQSSKPGTGADVAVVGKPIHEIESPAVKVPPLQEKFLPDAPMGANHFPLTLPNSTWTDGAESSSMPLAVPRRNNSSVPVVRVTVEIDAFAKGRIAVKRCVSTDPLPDFRGMPFDSCSFRHAELFRGENGTGRIVFANGDTSTKTVSLPPFGWKYWRYGNVLPSPLSVRFVSAHAGERSGIGIAKAGGLPCRITFDVIDLKNADVPKLDLVLYRNFEQDARCGSVSVWGRRERDSLRIGADFFHPWADDGKPNGGRVVIADDTPVEKGGTFSKDFQLPSRITGEVETIKYDIYADQSMTGGRPMAFDLALLDIAGRFKGSVGFTVEDRGVNPVVLEVDPTGPASGLHHGEKILSINGQGGSAPRFRKMLDSLKFGDLVEVKTAVGSNAATTSVFCAE